jgi:hypothetical protein
MYNVIIDAPDRVIKSICNSADEVANLVFNSIGFWQLSKYIREICPKMKVGDVKKLDDAGITIECIV